MKRNDRQECEAVRTTIVGGRPPGSGQALGAIPKGIEVLVKKASVDAAFRDQLLAKRGEAAAEIGLTLTDSEAMMLKVIPEAHLLAIVGRGVDKIVIALITVQWAYYARTGRGSALVERGKEYIEAAHGLALGKPRIVFRHLLPNVLPPLIVVGTVQVAHAILLEATLSFLGIGVPITKPSLGLLIFTGFEYMMSGKYWISFFPGIALLITIVSINLVGDQLRDVLNPRLRR